MTGILPIQNGESGASVRAKLNALISGSIFAYQLDQVESDLQQQIDSVIQQAIAAMGAAEQAGEDAQQAALDAQGVRDDLDALTEGFVGTIEGVVGSLTGRLDGVDSTLSDAQSYIDVLEGRIDDVVQDVEDNLLSVTGTINDLSNAVQNSLDGVNEDISDLQQEVSALSQQVDEDIEGIRDQIELNLDSMRTWDAVDAVDEVLSFLSGLRVEQFGTNQRLTDAGVYVNPEDGTVGIHGVDIMGDRISHAELRVDGVEAEINLKASVQYVNQAISNAILDPTQIPVIDGIETRLSTAEIAISGQNSSIASLTGNLTVEGSIVTMTSVTSRLDGVEGELTLKVSQSEFEGAETRLGQAEIKLEALDVPSITSTVQSSRELFDEVDLNTISNLGELLDLYQTREALQTGFAVAQSQLTAYVDENLQAEATARTTLATMVDTSVAALQQQQTVLSNASQSMAADLLQLTTNVGDVSSSLTNDYFTKSGTQDAIAAAKLNIVAELTEGPLGDLADEIGSVSSTLTNEYMSAVNVNNAIAAAKLDLKSELEAPEGSIGQINANLTSNYLTSAGVDEAIALGLDEFETEYFTGEGQVKASALTNYFTKSEATGAISTATTALSSSLTRNDPTSALSAGPTFWTSAAAGTPETRGTPNAEWVFGPEHVSVALVPGAGTTTTIYSRGGVQVSENDLIRATVVTRVVGTPGGGNNGSTGGRLVLAWLDADWNLIPDDGINVSNFAAVVGDDWKTVSVEGTAPAGAVNLRIGVRYALPQYSSTVTAQVRLLKAENANTSADVLATVAQNYLTETATNTAIAAATLALETKYFTPANGQVKASALSDYYTKSGTDGAIAVQMDALEAEYFNPVTGQVRAAALTNYYTQAQTNSAITSATTGLQSQINDIAGPDGTISNINSNLTVNYFTKTQVTDEIADAVSVATTNLKSELESPSGSIGQINADLTTNYVTKSDSASAIAAAETRLRSAISRDAPVSTFASGPADWTSSPQGVPETRPAPTPAWTFSDDAATSVVVPASGLNDPLFTRGGLQVVAGDMLKATARVRATGAAGGGGANGGRIVWAWMDTNWNLVTTTNSTFNASIGAGWNDVSFEHEVPVGAAIVRIGLRFSGDAYTQNATIEARLLRLENITASADVMATVESQYYTSTETDNAIAGEITEFNTLFREPDGQIKGSVLTNYFNKSDTNGLIAASANSINGNINQLRGEISGYQKQTASSADVTVGAAVTVTNASGELGQTGTILVTEGTTERIFAGATNGAAIMVPAAQAITFAGQRIRIGVLAKQAGANSATKFGIAYSTAGDGNSGYIPASENLTAGWKWFTFYYVVPAASSGTNHYIGIFGDDSKTGKSTRVARAFVQLAAVAEELPVINELSGDILDIKGLELGALTGTALGTLLTQLDVQAGGTSATIQQQGTAIADLEGNASAGYLIKAQAGGAVSLLDLVAADGSAGSVSVARLKADDILLDGSVSLPQLAVTDFSGNLVVNGSFVYNDLRGWTNIPPTFAVVPSGSGTIAQQNGPTGFILRIDTDAAVARFAYIGEFSCQPGEAFHGRMKYATAGDPRDVSMGIYFRWLNATGGIISTVPGAVVANTANATWQEAAGEVVAPAGAARCWLMLMRSAGGSGLGYVTDIEVTKKRSGTTLITPNSVTTDLVVSDNFVNWSTALFGGVMQSTNYVPGANGAGWRIDNAGNAEFGTLALREGAVSATYGTEQEGPIVLQPGGSYTTVLSITFAPSSNRKLLVTYSFTVDPQAAPGSPPSLAGLRYRLVWRSAIQRERTVTSYGSGDFFFGQSVSDVKLIDTGGTSTGTLELQMLRYNASTVRDMTMVVTELKR